MNDNIIINEDTILKVPLIVPMASKYFEKIDNKNRDSYYRAVDLRICLEKICDEFVYEFIKEIDKKNWDDLNLHKKLCICKKYLNKKCVQSLIDAKNIGNIGAHKGEEGKYTEEQFNKAQKSIFEFSLEILTFYLKKYGYTNLQNEGSWVPYIFSTLPPLYRVKVLKKYFEFSKEIIVIEKLAMAYTKCGMSDEMLDFLNNCLNENYVNLTQYISLLSKMKIIENNLDNFPIAKTIYQAKENFKVACNKIAPYCDLGNEQFVLLMSLIFYGKKANDSVKF